VQSGRTDDRADRVHARAAVGPVLAAALPQDKDGWRVVTLSFEHDRAAVHRLAGFADQVEVVTPSSVRAGLVATARQILRRYHATEG
jgi:predicted DNA-binding transcriptional regulator YafY